MNELLRSLEREQDHAHNFEKILNDPELSPLFNGYLRAIGSGVADPATVSLIEKHSSGNALTSGEIKALNASANEFNKRLGAAQRVLENLKDEGVAGLSSILEKSIPTLRPGEFQLYVKGIAVRNEPAFAALTQAVAHWKQSARDRISERQATGIAERLEKVRTTLGVPRSEVNRFLQMPDDSLRLQELKAAIGKSSWAASLTAFAQGSYLGPSGSAGVMNNLIEEYRQTAGKVREGLGDVLDAFESLDMTKDALWTEIPEIARKKSEQLREDQKPLTLKDAQQLVKPENVNKGFREYLKKLDPKAETAWDAARAKNAGKPTDLWKDTVNYNGADHSFDEAWKGYESTVGTEMRRRGALTSLIELLFSLFQPGELAKAKNRLPDMA
jgi:hypothetical protein